MVDKRIAELSLVFVLVGMICLVPVITGEALGHTKATVTASATVYNIHPGLVEKRLDEGKWLDEPHCFDTNECSWTTEGSPVGGPEAGHVIYNYYNPAHVAKVVFRWYNPRSGTNTCGAVVLEQHQPGHVGAGCDITQGGFATAKYWVNYRR